MSPASTLEQVQAGRIRLVGLLSGPRLALLPDLASFSETVEDFDAAISRMVIFAPAATPATVIQTLNDSLRATLADPELGQAFASSGAVPTHRDPAEVAEHVGREHAIWKEAAAAVMP